MHQPNNRVILPAVLGQKAGCRKGWEARAVGGTNGQSAHLCLNSTVGSGAGRAASVCCHCDCEAARADACAAGNTAAAPA